MVMSYRDFEKNVREAVRDVLSSMDDDALGLLFRDGDFEFHEIADSCVPAYYTDLCDLCLEGNLMNVEPEIGEAKSPAQMMAFVLYEEAYRLACDAFESFKEDEEDETDRFRCFLQDFGRPEDLEDAETAYGLWVDDPRRNVPEWDDDSSFYEDIWRDWADSNDLFPEEEEEESVRDLCDPAYMPREKI